MSNMSKQSAGEDYDSSLAIFGVEDDGLMEAIHTHLHRYGSRERKQTRSSSPPAIQPTRQVAFYPCPPPENEEYAPEVERDNISSMYGRYTKDLSQYAKSEARRIEKLRRESPLSDVLDKPAQKTVCGNSRLAVGVAWIWQRTFAKLGEDWVFLALLARLWLYRDLTSHALAQYLSWILLPVFLVVFSSGFVHIVAPSSIGSGIPEMKTILRGVALKEYLTFKTLIAKAVGLTATLGSGIPLGKEGPSVHMASIIATLLSKLVTSFKGIYDNESRNCEMLAAACAVGVASCFAAPIGGVLFSIEVTTVYFAVRNYSRAFFAAVCGATTFRLLAVCFDDAQTVTAVFRTNFEMEFPFDPQELFVFALLGVVCGFGGAFYVWSHRKYVLFMRSSKKMNSFLQQNRFLYPAIVAFLVSTVSFPLGTGRFVAGDLTTHSQVTGLFTSFTWTKDNFTVEEASILRHWVSSYPGDIPNVFLNLACFTLFTFVFSIICSTLPVPSGSFIPVFKIGGALGRATGELMHLALPTGIAFASERLAPIIPGGYAIVGAAAFAGAVTHSISVSVIVFEVTGQITHIIPMMLAVLIANAIASFLQPSLYDSIILIKKLPYLPDLLPGSSGMYNIYAEHFMVKDVKYIWKGITYKEVKEVLKGSRKLRSFPLVDSPENMILLGSVPRIALISLIDKQIGRERRLEVAAKWQQERLNKEREQRKLLEERQRRPSRFEVTPAPDILGLPPAQHNPIFGSTPRKSILKKTNSFTLKGFSPLTQQSPTATPYTTVTGAESRIRLAFEAIFRKSSTLQDVEPTGKKSTDPIELMNDTSPVMHSSLSDNSVTRPQIVKAGSSNVIIGNTKRRVTLPRERVCDMSLQEQKQWQDTELAEKVDFTSCNVDPAPFSLIERTSLLKVHSLFSMIGVDHAYVTATGKLVGVVALKEERRIYLQAQCATTCSKVLQRALRNVHIVHVGIGYLSIHVLCIQKLLQLRKAIEDANSGNFQAEQANDHLDLTNPATPLMSDKVQEYIDTADNELQSRGETVTSLDSVVSSDIELENLNNNSNNTNRNVKIQ